MLAVTQQPDGSGHELFVGGGATGAIMASDVDWAATPLGPVDGWPPSLRGAVRLVLSSRYPMLLLWGDALSQLYNDGYSALIGDKHPAALGDDVRVTLAEGWDVLGPIIDEVRRTGVASWIPALQLLLERRGYREEAYFDVSHAALRDDAGRTEGVFTVCTEVTEQIVGERRLRLLHELSLGAGSTLTVERTCASLVDAVAGYPLDVPFAAIYLRAGGALHRASTVGDAADALPVTVDLDAPGLDRWRLTAAAAGGGGRVDDVDGVVTVPGGPWGDPVTTAVTLPLPGGDPGRPLGVLLAGVSPSRELDDRYRSFYELLGQQVSVAVRNALAYADERRRAEALAELDRVKTDFFTNVSHEFRTPLTLMLGPLADALADGSDPLSAGQHQRIDTARRNATRLLGLVNDLLTFSSLEAGRARTEARAVDLAALTTEICSAFRAAVERAGLTFVVDCPPLPHPVVVDPGHWEKIVANLLSNALKFTFVGRIQVFLRPAAAGVVLRVEDTGIGIGPDELPRLFERFHRVPGARSRSHEGTGIGLAMVRELTRLLCGDVTASSTVGSGTTFTLTVPWAGPDVAAGTVGSPVAGAAVRAAAEEAMQWLAGPQPAGRGAPTAAADTGDSATPDDLRGARVLVVDDNSDMRAYLVRVLAAEQWDVEAVGDGLAALDAIGRRRPDLVLTDVMMPHLDGFGLVRELRGNEETATLPIVILSARAGSEASVEGFTHGADDYVVKPFRAGDLIARLRGTLQLARARGSSPARPVAPDTAALIASGRTLDAAVRMLTAQARVLAGGARAVTVLAGSPGAGELRFTSVRPDGPARPADPVRLPLEGRDGRPVGSIEVRAPVGHTFDGVDRAVLTGAAGLLAALADGAWGDGGAPDVAGVLRRSMLPVRGSEPAAVELAARHLPGRAAAGSGGEWYEALALPDGRLLLGLGEVSGGGLAATVTMGLLRYAVRGCALDGLAPGLVLARLGVLLDRLGAAAGTDADLPAAPRLDAVFVGYLDPSTGVLEWSADGHPAPVLIEPHRPPHRLGLPPAPPDTHRCTLVPGAQLVLHTDRRPGLFDRIGPAAPGGHVRDLVDAVVDAGPGGRSAALVVLAVRRVGPPPASVPADPPADIGDVDTELVYPQVPAAAARMRRDVRGVLADLGVPADVTFELLVAVSEAVNNAVEHAQTPSRAEIVVRVRVSGGVVRLTVQDFGTWRERRPSMDRGHGSTLMSAYGDVRVVSTETGTTVTIERKLTG